MRVDHRRQRNVGAQAYEGAAVTAEKKTATLIDCIDEIWDRCFAAFKQARIHRYAKGLALSGLVAMGRKTVTGFLRAAGRQFADWSAAYRFFSESRFDADKMLDEIRRSAFGLFPDDGPLVASMDDTILRKRGRRIPGVAYRRDPLSPPFHVNLITGQRFIQISAAAPGKGNDSPARAIPIDFTHAPSLKKPGKRATSQQWKEYRRAAKKHTLSSQGLKRIKRLRAGLDADECRRELWLTVDGSYTNKTVLKGLPDRTVLIGRIRKDAKLYYPPIPRSGSGAGRKRVYGERAPTPKQVLKDPCVPWKTVPIFASGKTHNLRYKTISPLLSRMAGGERRLRLIVIAPLAYRLRKGSRLLYRRPAFLIITDPGADIREVIQAYFNRWDIEVNFRDEKTLLGIGEAQVRSEQSVESVPSFIVASYSVLLLAAIKAFGINGFPDLLPPPKWYRKNAKQRASTSDLISHLRGELWGQALGNFEGFASQKDMDTKLEKFDPELKSAVLYALN